MKTLSGLGSLGLLVLLSVGCMDNEKAEVFAESNQLLVESVGDPCVPRDESMPAFAGFGEGETNVDAPDSNSDTCGGTGYCMAYHFQGRVTCPNGSDPTSSSGSTCNTPDGTPVTVAVKPQLAERPAEDAVICTCRCDGPSGGGPYCACPDGFTCQAFDDIPLEASNLAGSYCLKNDML
jgi:hypothetical protein